MTAPTIAVEWLLARAAVRSTGLLHVVSRRDSGALNPVCGANPIRSERIETFAKLADVSLLCPGCGTMAASIGGTVVDGVALLLGLSTAAATARLLDVPIDAIALPRTHARQAPGDVEGLIESIRERGVVAPVVLRRRGDRFEVIDGARRIHAAEAAGLTVVPAIVRDATDSDALLDGLVANLHRADLNPIELAHAYVHAIEALGLTSKAELGRRLGISREQISNTIRLLDLPAEDQEAIAAGDLTVEAGRKLLAKPKPQAAKLEDVAGLLEQLLGAKVAVTERGDRTRIVIDVTGAADRDRIISALGRTAAAA